MKTRVRKYWDTKWGLWMYAVDWWQEAADIPNPYSLSSIYIKYDPKPLHFNAGWWDWPKKPTAYSTATFYSWSTPDEQTARDLAQRLSIDPGAQLRAVIAEFSDGIEFKPLETEP